MRAATKDSTADPGYPKLSKEDVVHSTAAERTSPPIQVDQFTGLMGKRVRPQNTPGPTAVMREQRDSKAEAFFKLSWKC